MGRKDDNKRLTMEMPADLRNAHNRSRNHRAEVLSAGCVAVFTAARHSGLTRLLSGATPIQPASARLHCARSVASIASSVTEPAMNLRRSSCLECAGTGSKRAAYSGFPGPT